MKKAGFKKYDSAYKRTESPFTKYASDAQRKAIWASKNEKKSAMKKVDKKALNEVSKELKKASKTHAGQADKIQSAMKKKRSATGKDKIHRTLNPFDRHERVDYHGLGAKGLNKRRIKLRKEKDMRADGGQESGFKKISASCKAQAKKKFKVSPSAYASGWGVRCTRGDFKKK